MKLIKHMAEQLEDEVCGSIEYAKDALEYKFSRPQLAELYYKLANVEMSHVTELHEAVMKVVEEAKSKNVNVPHEMMEKWEHKHGELIDKMAEAKIYIGMFK